MSAGEETTSLCDLPLPILELIYHNVDDRARTALLRTSRWGRDCVLQLASSFTSAVHDVTLDTLARRESLARMAARVIRGEAEHGRLNSFTIDGSMVQREHNQERFTTLLADVLAAVNQQPGRYPVRNFTFKVGLLGAKLGGLYARFDVGRHPVCASNGAIARMSFSTSGANTQFLDS
jgi:hypothetical protein